MVRVDDASDRGDHGQARAAARHVSQGSTTPPPPLPRPWHAPTAEEQAGLTPDAVLDDLMAGNARFVSDEMREPHPRERVHQSAREQHPKAMILSCVDSRVPVEMVFDQCIGDIFVGRVAGAIDSEEQLGSMEYATAAAGAKLVMVLGHQSCGAVQSAIRHIELGHLTHLLNRIEPAIEAAAAGFEGEQAASNPAFVDAVVRRHTAMTVAHIRRNSDVLRELETRGQIRIVAAYYSLETGRVTLLDA